MFRLIMSLSHGKTDSDTLSAEISSIKVYNFTNWDVSLITLTVHCLELSLDPHQDNNFFRYDDV